jgi:hypothetical protein
MIRDNTDDASRDGVLQRRLHPAHHSAIILPSSCHHPVAIVVVVAGTLCFALAPSQRLLGALLEALLGSRRDLKGPIGGGF